MKISFENIEIEKKVLVSAEEMASITKRIEQADERLLISSEEVLQKARVLCSN